jgi:hypothetical protein
VKFGKEIRDVYPQRPRHNIMQAREYLYDGNAIDSHGVADDLG